MSDTRGAEADSRQQSGSGSLPRSKSKESKGKENDPDAKQDLPDIEEDAEEEAVDDSRHRSRKDRSNRDKDRSRSKDKERSSRRKDKKSSSRSRLPAADEEELDLSADKAELVETLAEELPQSGADSGQSARPAQRGPESSDLQGSRAPLPSAAPRDIYPRCPLHPSDILKYFCLSCEVAICSECRVVGTHQGVLHSVATIADAFQAKLRTLAATVESRLEPRKEKLSIQLRQIEARMNEIHGKAQAIQQETETYFHSVLERLHSAEVQHQAALESDAHRLQMQITTIESLINEALLPKTTPEAMTAFLSKFREVKEQCERLASKPMALTADLTKESGELPREVTNVTSLTERHQTAMELLRVKDQMIWHLLRERDELKQRETRQGQLLGALQQAADREINEYMTLTDRLSSQLAQFRLCCKFCTRAMSRDVVNSPCSANIVTSRNIHSMTDGTGRHFFEPV